MELVDANTEVSDLKSSRAMSKKLSETQMFQDYEAAFSEASGLPLAIRPIQSFQIAMQGKSKQNPFCALMAKTSKSCVACLEIQSKLERGSAAQAKIAQLFCGNVRYHDPHSSR